MTLALAVLAAGIVQPWRLLAQAPQAAKGVKFSQVSEADLKEWLGYLASDELQGRQIYTEGYGVAAQYIADHLKAWGVKPMGDNGSYFQIVKLRGYKVTNNSSVTIDGAGGSKTFKNGDHVTFATNAGKKQTVTFNGVQFVGSTPPAADTLKGKLAVWMNSTAPAVPGGAAGGGRAAAAADAAADAAVRQARPSRPVRQRPSDSHQPRRLHRRRKPRWFRRRRHSIRRARRCSRRRLRFVGAALRDARAVQAAVAPPRVARTATSRRRRTHSTTS
jgi:hypothetical protein